MRTGSPRQVSVKGKYEQEYAWFVLGDSIPGLSMEVRSAARRIIDATAHGDPELILSLPAKMATKLHGIAPEFMQHLMRLQNALLPAPPERWDSGQGVRRKMGKESESSLTRSFVTALTQKAAEENNQLANG